MARRFRRTRRGIGATLDPAEADLVASMFDDVVRLLAGEEAEQPAVPADRADAAAGAADGAHDAVGPEDAELAALERLFGSGEAVAAPTDPALARLLPPASRDDDEAAADFRRYTQEGLRDRKAAGLRRAAATLRRPGPLLLGDEEARAFLTALTDVRLVLAERLDVRTDSDAAQLAERRAVPGQESAAWLAAVYDFLTWLQEGLAETLLRDLPRGGSR